MDHSLIIDLLAKYIYYRQLPTTPAQPIRTLDNAYDHLMSFFETCLSEDKAGYIQDFFTFLDLMGIPYKLKE